MNNKELPVFQLVMHLVSTYLDSQLPPLPSLPDGRPFSSQHFVRLPSEQIKNVLTIVLVSANPPHYQLQTKEETYNIPKVNYYNNLSNFFIIEDTVDTFLTHFPST